MLVLVRNPALFLDKVLDGRFDGEIGSICQVGTDSIANAAGLSLNAVRMALGKYTYTSLNRTVLSS
jgi:hypothetical protein